VTVSSNNTSAPTRDELVGSWKLVSAFSTEGAEHSEQPYGPHPAGFLTYSIDGRVSTLISSDGRNPLSIGGGTLEEKAEAFDTFFAYAGQYKLEGDKVTHHVEISSIQNYVGKDLVRRLIFEGDRIVLVTPPTPVNGKIKIFELIWQRVLGI
jgi:Lipocalin-like domain